MPCRSCCEPTACRSIGANSLPLFGLCLSNRAVGLVKYAPSYQAKALPSSVWPLLSRRRPRPGRRHSRRGPRRRQPPSAARGRRWPGRSPPTSRRWPGSRCSNRRQGQKRAGYGNPAYVTVLHHCLPLVMDTECLDGRTRVEHGHEIRPTWPVKTVLLIDPRNPLRSPRQKATGDTGN